jgi:hypothetical protein
LNARRCLKIADRMDGLLQAELGLGIDLQRLVGDALYARDVLLVCDAFHGQELAELARQFRRALDEPPPQEGTAPAAAAGWGARSSGFMSSLRDAFRPSQPSTTLPPETLDEATRADHARRGHTGGLRSRWRR